MVARCLFTRPRKGLLRYLTSNRAGALSSFLFNFCGNFYSNPPYVLQLFQINHFSAAACCPSFVQPNNAICPVWFRLLSRASFKSSVHILVSKWNADLAAAWCSDQTLQGVYVSSLYRFRWRASWLYYGDGRQQENLPTDGWRSLPFPWKQHY